IRPPRGMGEKPGGLLQVAALCRGASAARILLRFPVPTRKVRAPNGRQARRVTMSRRILLKLAVAGCLSVGLAVAGTVGFAASIRTVDMNDQCDPATFNAAIGPGTCIGNNGGVSFDTFIAELSRTELAGAWH